QYVEDMKMLPAQAGLDHFVMRLDSREKNMARWKSLAPLGGANRFGQLKKGAMVLAETERSVPLLLAQDYGQGRSMAFAADTTYQWFLAGQAEEHQRFWRQAILWLAKKEMQGDSSVWVKLNERRFRPGQGVEMTFGTRGQDGLPLPDSQF